MELEELVTTYHIIEDKFNKEKNKKTQKKLLNIMIKLENEIESRMEFAQFDDYAF